MKTDKMLDNIFKAKVLLNEIVDGLLKPATPQKGTHTVEIPTGMNCQGVYSTDGQETCRFFGDLEGSGNACLLFDARLGNVRCEECTAAYPHGATVEIKPRKGT